MRAKYYNQIQYANWHTPQEFAVKFRCGIVKARSFYAKNEIPAVIPDMEDIKSREAKARAVEQDYTANELKELFSLRIRDTARRTETQKISWHKRPKAAALIDRKLLEQYAREHTALEVAKFFGISKQCAYTYMKRYGIKWVRRHKKATEKVVVDEKTEMIGWLMKKYSDEAIANFLRRSVPGIARIRKMLKIRKRSVKN